MSSVLLPGSGAHLAVHRATLDMNDAVGERWEVEGGSEGNREGVEGSEGW